MDQMQPTVVPGGTQSINMAPPQVQRQFAPPSQINPIGTQGPQTAMGGPSGFMGMGALQGLLAGIPGWTGSAGEQWSFNPITGQFSQQAGDDTGAYGHQLGAISSIINQMMGTGANIYGTQAGFLGNLYNTAMSPVLAEIAQTPHLLAQQRFDTAFPAVFGQMGDFMSGSQGFGNPGQQQVSWDPTRPQFPDRPQAPTLPQSPFQGLPVA